MKSLLSDTLKMRVRTKIAKNGGILFTDRKGGIYIIIGETAQRYPSLAAVGQSMGLIQPWETLVPVKETVKGDVPA
jgi:hypothetical protein